MRQTTGICALDRIASRVNASSVRRQPVASFTQSDFAVGSGCHIEELTPPPPHTNSPVSPGKYRVLPPRSDNGKAVRSVQCV